MLRAECSRKVSGAAIEHYARIVKNLANKRRVIALDQKLMQLGQDELLDAREALETVGESLRQLETEALESGDPKRASQTIRISEVEREEVEWLWWQLAAPGQGCRPRWRPWTGKVNPNSRSGGEGEYWWADARWH
ncbi:MAG: hypothetical protein ACREN8_10470 [Candidatus Dormibacteraceae bacterium]